MTTDESHNSLKYLWQEFLINPSSNMYLKCILSSQTLLGIKNSTSHLSTPFTHQEPGAGLGAKASGTHHSLNFGVLPNPCMPLVNITNFPVCCSPWKSNYLSIVNIPISRHLSYKGGHYQSLLGLLMKYQHWFLGFHTEKWVPLLPESRDVAKVILTHW